MRDLQLVLWREKWGCDSSTVLLARTSISSLLCIFTGLLKCGGGGDDIDSQSFLKSRILFGSDVLLNGTTPLTNPSFYGLSIEYAKYYLVMILQKSVEQEIIAMSR